MQNTIYYRVSFETFIDNFARKLISSTVKISDLLEAVLLPSISIQLEKLVLIYNL